VFVLSVHFYPPEDSRDAASAAMVGETFGDSK